MASEKQTFIWTTNGTVWAITGSLAGDFIPAESQAFGGSQKWNIPRSIFLADFIEAKDLQYFDNAITISPDTSYSTRLLDASYAGSANRIREDAGNTEQDIGFLDAYGYDIPAYNTFVGAANGFVRTWYDQFGADDGVQTTNANQPTFQKANASFNRPQQIW